MKRYRLKKEARPFFDKRLGDIEGDIMMWDEANVPVEALEVVTQPGQDITINIRACIHAKIGDKEEE